MRAVVQRVLSASVTVDGREVSSIGRGLMCLIGIASHDTAADMDYIVKKILSLRVFPSAAQDEALSRQWDRSVTDIQGEVLCVSQFTLYATTRKGSKPDFHNALKSEHAIAFYQKFLDKMRQTYVPDRIRDGEFGAMMNVALTNEGPVTIILDSNDPRSGGASGTSAPGAVDEATQVRKAQQQRAAEEKQRKREENDQRREANLSRKQGRQDV